MGWVGSSSVKYDSLPKTTLVNMFQPRVHFDTQHFYIIQNYTVHIRRISFASQPALPSRPVGERLILSGQPYHYWRSFKAVAENCWSNGTHSLGFAWFTA